MAAKNNQAVADIMRGLRLQYLEQIKERLSVLIPLAAKSEWDATERATARTQAHQLSGTGTTYGFKAISETGRVLEEALIDHSAEGAEFFKQPLAALIQACQDALNAPAESIPDEHAGKKKPATPRNSHMPYVLLVDDDPSVEAMLRMLLVDAATVIAAADATRAMAIITEYTPDLILLDNEMPGEMNGIALLEKLHATPEYSTIPVMMLTASQSPETVMKALMAGATDYIVKPFDAQQVTDKVKARLARLKSVILIADDDEAVRTLLCHKFQAAGCKVLVAADGERAWDIMRDKDISLALLDRMMPGFEGMTLLNMMRETPALEKIPVVFLTARHYGSDVMEGFNTGAADYITKPFNPDEVVMRCLRLLTTSAKVQA